MFLLNGTLNAFIQNVGRFTIQNVPIKFRDSIIVRGRNTNLQYKMFLLNPLVDLPSIPHLVFTIQNVPIKC